MSGESYIGRFAPSPTGPLHFGSLIAALGSYLQARSQQGKWLVRIEDIDPPREIPGSADSILRTLEAFGLHWDDAVLYQSTRLDAYREALDRLISDGAAYRCRCTRKLVMALPGGVYAGRCRKARVPASEDHSVRVRTGSQPVQFHDALQGDQEQCLEREVGDYIVRRRDGLFAYQLAVTLDDHFQGVTDIVRGHDLLHTTARQIHLRDRLGLSQPTHAHLPLVLDTAAKKLSKQAGAAALPGNNLEIFLYDALRVLWQNPPEQLRSATVADQLDWAVSNWNINSLKEISAVVVDNNRQILQTLKSSAGLPQFDLK